MPTRLELTMKNNIFNFVFCFSAYFQKATTDSETVWLKDVTTRLQTDKRALSDPDLPEQLSFLLKRKSNTLILNLKRNYDINPNADIYIVRKLGDGRSLLERTENVEREDVAYYQDKENGAFMTARCVERSNGQCDILINGNIRIGHKNYYLRHSKNDLTSRKFLDVTDLLGKRYFLQDQSNIEKDILFLQDLSNIEIDMPGEQDKLNVERDESYLQDRAHIARDMAVERKDKKENEYYVKVLVLLDSSVWDLFVSTLNSSLDITKREPKAKKNIRRYYSYIMNGVDELYKGINDTNIAIHVKIRGFVIHQWEAEFKHHFSKVNTDHGTKWINSSLYLADLYNMDISGKFLQVPEYDQVILFTRYSFYRRATDTIFPGGLSIPSSVCVPGQRVEIVHSTDYLKTTYIAAHELGHSLGAEHDGDGNAKSCKAEDGFIMTPLVPDFDPTKEYSTNPWLFSTCSVEAFKRTLANKDCVTKEPKYNQTETDAWNKLMKELPGERYTHSMQCEIINGRGSKYCGTQIEKICLFMHCTDPKTGKCMHVYFGAATGTLCGTNKWCKQGLCVDKDRK